MASSDPPSSVDEYLGALPIEKRNAPNDLRRAIHASQAGLEEAISYKIPVFKFEGCGLISMSAAKNHCSLHLMSSPLAEAVAEELAEFGLSGSTARFQPDSPLPDRIVARIVQGLVAERRNP
jgi:uncharacterized protein YdhG (YjbR/CyaY superfamily)